MNSKPKTIIRSLVTVFVILVISGCIFYSSLYYQHSNSFNNEYSNLDQDIEYFESTSIKGQSIDTVPIFPNNNLEQESQIPFITYYLSKQNEGIIGYYRGIEFDNPSDNIFNIHIDKQVSKNSRVWITYKL